MKDEQQMSELEKLEMEILMATPQRKQNIDALAVEYKKDINVYVNSNPGISRKEKTVLEKNFNNPIRDGKFMEKVVVELKNENAMEDMQKITTFEVQKNEFKIEEKQIIDVVENELEEKKKIIRNKFRSVVKRALAESRKHKKEANKFETEIQRVNKIKETVNQQITFMANRIESPDNKELIMDDLENSIKKMSIDQKQSSESSSQKNSSSEISDYLDESENSSEEQLSFEDQELEFPEAFEREHLDLENLTVDLDTDENLNSTIIKRYESETKGDKEELNEILNGLNPTASDENEEIVKDQEKNEKNTSLIVKHELMGDLLNTVSLKVELREVEKMEKVHHIMDLKKQVTQLTDKREVDLEKIEQLKQEILVELDGLVKEFGEAEIMLLEDEGVSHYTLGDFKEDLSRSEMEYIFKQPELVIDGAADQLFI
jgi:hypothetical protein